MDPNQRPNSVPSAMPYPPYGYYLPHTNQPSFSGSSGSVPVPMGTPYLMAPCYYPAYPPQAGGNQLPYPYMPAVTLPQTAQRSDTVSIKPQSALDKRPDAAPLIPSKRSDTAPSAQPAPSKAKPVHAPHKTTSSHSSVEPDLSNPEELEKWKAERRKRFPSLAKKEATSETTPAASAPSTAEKDPDGDLESEDEEGALSESDAEKIALENVGKKSQRLCKYFARGRCRSGTACKFVHEAHSASPPGGTGRKTIFEKLLRIEEQEMHVKFYECIKAICNRQ